VGSTDGFRPGLLRSFGSIPLSPSFSATDVRILRKTITTVPRDDFLLAMPVMQVQVLSILQNQKIVTQMLKVKTNRI
jgi:hypothetical protein